MSRYTSTHQVRRNKMGWLHEDHQFMTLAACETLSAEVAEMLRPDLGLMLREFCSLPDVNHPVFGTLGGWEMYGPYVADARRELDASVVLGWDPLAKRGCRWLHHMPDAIEAVSVLSKRAIDFLAADQRRRGLACLGAAAHYLQDVATFPNQQTLHRSRPDELFPSIRLPGYRPKCLFERPSQIDAAAIRVLKKLQIQIWRHAPAIRRAIRDGDTQKRMRLHLHCDCLGAAFTADLFTSVLSLVESTAPKPLDHQEIFPKLDADRMPLGYLVKRPEKKQWIGCADTEGDRPRTVGGVQSHGHQLSLAATGSSWLQWHQTLIDMIGVTDGQSLDFGAVMCGIHATGKTTTSLRWLTATLEPCGQTHLTLNNRLSGWQTLQRAIRPPRSARYGQFVFHTEKNRGCVLLDRWWLRQASRRVSVTTREATRPNRAQWLLHLKPTRTHEIRDTSPIPTEPIVCVRRNQPHCLEDSQGAWRFSGKHDFVEIPYNPRYQPMMPQGVLSIAMQVWSDRVQTGDLVSAISPGKSNQNGFRIALERGRLSVRLYHAERGQWLEKFAPLTPRQWHHLQVDLAPSGRVLVTINDRSAEARAPFARRYAHSDYYLGSTFGVERFFSGRLRNVGMWTGSSTPPDEDDC